MGGGRLTKGFCLCMERCCLWRLTDDQRAVALMSATEMDEGVLKGGWETCITCVGRSCLIGTA